MTFRLRKTIFVACRELGLDGDTRRAMQEAVTGKASLTDMTAAELQAVLDHLKGQGFTPSGGKTAPAGRRDLRLIHAQWRALGDAGKLKDPSRDGLNAFVRARFGNAWGAVPADVDRLRDHAQIAAVIDALKSWIRREGVPFDRKGGK